MSAVELTLADLWATQISPDDHPIGHLRPVLDTHEIVPISALGAEHDRTRVRVAGLVTHRQRPVDGRRGHVPQPGGRDRDAQRRLLAPDVAALRPGRPADQRDAGPRHDRALRRGDQPGRRQAGAAQRPLPGRDAR